MLDLLITNGVVVDGSGAPRQRTDVGIRYGKVCAIGTMDEPARETLDAEGQIIAPGFVDIHTH
jgi:N-acyl-D-amino-acid deacylase